jgi:mono/diheme cytochrome c family protein
MSNLFDILLRKPLPDAFLRGLLLITFSLHILFVLFMIGTAILAIYYFIHAWWGGRLQELRWDKEILRTFLAHKSLAVVFGVAPLLLIQVSFSVPFFTGVSLFAPYWILMIVFLIVSFLSLDALGHKIYVHHYFHLAFGLFGLALLLLVPGIFVAVLVATENSDQWVPIVKSGYLLNQSLAYHWFFRYLHILGAAIVFGAVFHYFFSTKDEIGKKGSLLKWMVFGILIQLIIGIMLYISLPARPGFVAHTFLLMGVTATAVLLWIIFFSLDKNRLLTLKAIFPLFLLILIPMLLTRQMIQDKKVLPLMKQLESNALDYEENLTRYTGKALNGYQSHLRMIYDNGETIYSKSCTFCHGERAEGNGPESKNLGIPPEDLSAIRTTRPYLHRILSEGISGSAMPYFSFFDRYKLDSLTDDLDKKYHLLGLPEPIPAGISDETFRQAEKIYADTCTSCHGRNGKGTTLSQGFRPQPPDFSVYSLSPKRSFKIITQGYPGTVMPPFRYLKEDVRWGLVRIINSKRRS